jgi:CheY-like chemotaxis protein
VPVDCAVVVASLEPMLRRLLGEQTELVVELPPEGAWVEADPAQLEQVVLNLAVNARDAMPEGGRLTIGVRVAPAGSIVPPRPEPRDYDVVVLTVRDTGEGMTPEIATRAFEPFFTTKPAGVGTGLGLATVYGIVRQSGGEIDLATAPGAGTAFTIVLPRIAPPAEQPASAGAAAGDRPPATVLVVEDEASVRTLVRRVLEADGHVVLDAADATAAETLAEALGAAPDLLLTDLVLPGRSGAELARRLEARWPGLPVVFMSGYAPPEAGLDAVAGERLFVAKPFSPDQLRRAVGAALEGYRRDSAEGAA